MAKSCSQFPRGLDSDGCFLIYLPGLFFLMVSCEGRAKDRKKFFYPLIYNDRLRACPYDGIPIDPGIRSASDIALRYALPERFVQFGNLTHRFSAFKCERLISDRIAQ